MHYRSANNDSRGGATVAILQNPANPALAIISIARCNPADVFCKKIGRDISAGRIRAVSKGRAVQSLHTVEIADPAHVKTSVAAVLHEEMMALGLC